MRYLKFFFKSKWDFEKVKKKKFLLIDGNSHPFLKYYKKKDFNILYRRGERINVRILLRCILNFKISTLNYFKIFIKLAQPKLILTAFDYHPIFYKLSKISTAKTLMLQKGKRSVTEGIFNNKSLIEESRKEDFYVDYIFLYNKFVCENYKKIIKGKYFSIGSFENNFSKLKLSTQKREILYISDFKIDDNNQIRINCENDDLVVYHLHKLALSNKIKFNILPKQVIEKRRQMEFSFYKNILKKDFTFIKKKNIGESYKIINRFKYIFCTHSTLGVENLSKGGRTGFIFFKSKNNPTKYYRLGHFEKIPHRGPFWTSKNKFDFSELKKIFYFVIKSKDKVWKSKSKLIAQKILKFDYKNKIFRSIVDKELNRRVN